MRTDSASQYNAINAGDLSRLRRDAGAGDEAGIHEVAKQFESLFLQMMMKGMRDASIGDGGMFSSDATRQYRQLFDRQISMQAAEGQGFGIAAMVERQMHAAAGHGGGEVGEASGNNAALAAYRQRALPATSALGSRDTPTPQPHMSAAEEASEATDIQGGSRIGSGRWDSPEAFVEDVLPAARRTAAALNVPARALVAQAALESGWGARTLQAADGSPSFNLFNIKAHGWQGARVRVPTLEYRDGAAVREQAEFRAYGSVDAAFADYAAFLRDNPRYQQALTAGADDPSGFVKGLEAAGYATDPRYAEKLREILDGPTLQDSMAGLKDSADRTTT